MPFAPSHSAQIHYTSHGEGPAIVLLQGLGLSSRFWFEVPDLLANDPAHKRRVLAIDNRGTGKSERPRGVWSVATMADDVAAVLDHAGVEQAIVIGISMGGMIAQHFALRHPKRIRGLVLFATTPGHLYGTMPAPSAIARLVSIPFGGKRGSRNLSRVLLPRSKWSRGREILGSWSQAMKEESPSGATFAAHFFAVSFTHMTGHRLARIQCPTMVVAGREDTLIPLANAKTLASRIPNATLEIIEDAGHAVFAEDRDLVRRMVERVEERTMS